VPAWLIWIIIAAGLAAAETVSLDFVLVMLAGGAAAGGVAAAVGLPAAAQVAVAIASALALLAFVRPVAKAHLTSGSSMPMHTAALVGKEAIVTSTVDAHDGRVRLNGADWSARCFDESQVIPVGTAVRVMEISGATAVVWRDEITRQVDTGWQEPSKGPA
jgi:membrane protein implicated in regulation of membrane protease activity